MAERATGHTLIPVGVDYCIRHHGLRNEDMERCDFVELDLDGQVEPDDECVLRQLVYVGTDCDACEDTGWLVTSSIDDGFPCPVCTTNTAENG